MRNPVGIEVLRSLLGYDPESGLLRWKERVGNPSFNTQFAGQIAMIYPSEKGYLTGSIFNRRYKAHRVAFAIMTGRWPEQIDHINGNPADNRWENLREVTGRENQKNMKRRRDNTSGHTGVGWSNKERRWVASLGQKRIGAFVEIADAVKARKEAEKEHGYHPNHGR